jgi:hypothetical protein
MRPKGEEAGAEGVANRRIVATAPANAASGKKVFGWAKTCLPTNFLGQKSSRRSPH